MRGAKIAGGNIFEGPRSEEYPTPPTKTPYYFPLFADAAKPSLAIIPIPIPPTLNSNSYTNPDGITRPGCLYCGFCDRFGCMIGAKSQPTNTLLPIVQRQKSRRHSQWLQRAPCRVRKTRRWRAGRVTGVNYVDASGEEVFQPATLVFLGSWTLNNTRLLLLSGIGEPYDPATGKGVVGRNLTHQVSFTAATAFFEKPLNRFMGAAPAGMRIADFDGDTSTTAICRFCAAVPWEALGKATSLSSVSARCRLR